MSIRMKIVLVILPVLMVTVILVGVSSYFNASTGITRIAKDFLGFKAEEVEKYAQGQWQLLVENNFTQRPEMVRATQLGVESYARSIIRSSTERILSFDETASLVMATEPITITDDEKLALQQLIDSRSTELTSLTLGKTAQIAKGFYFQPFQWYFLLTEEQDIFYQDLHRITRQTLYMLIGAIVIVITLTLFFSSTLLKPLKRVIGSMKTIITSNDLSERVTVEYQDETGELAHTFNIMIAELEKAYTKIKAYALKAVVAQKNESRIRNIFQKYVPQELIDRYYENPESMLVGENRVLSILFADIRSFTSISEKMEPAVLVNSLNQYFSVMVDIIMNRGGVIDKYIGDAIMAFFGAPVKHEDDAYQSALAGIEMVEALKIFNTKQLKAGRPEFNIGIGINYGVVTVGNIGTDKKMDYTVIGDMVNLASRLEALTKVYCQQLLISESLHSQIKDSFPWRRLDRVAVKGRKHSVNIYTIKKKLTPNEKKAWAIHNEAMGLYYERKFNDAAVLLQEVLSLLPDDQSAAMLLERATACIHEPPPEDWRGVHIMETK